MLEPYLARVFAKSIEVKASIAKAWQRAAKGVVLLGFWGLLLYGCTILAYQVYFWLMYGEWVAVKVIYFFIPVGGANTPVELVPDWLRGSWHWLLAPDSWFGVHKIVYWLFDVLPVSLLCIGYAGTVLIMIALESEAHLE